MAVTPGAQRYHVLRHLARWVHAPLIVVAVILRNEVGRTAYITALCAIAVTQMYLMLRARVAEAELAEAEENDDSA